MLLIKSYLTNRWHCKTINLCFNSREELLSGVPHVSVLGPILFNIYINDLFYELVEAEASSLADDTTFYACDVSLPNLVRRLEHDTYIAIKWFENNYMKLNKEKCHFLIAGHKYEHFLINVGENQIWESQSEKLL